MILSSASRNILVAVLGLVQIQGAWSHLTPRAEPTISTIFQFPLGTWLENLAFRPNGDLLVTLVDRPELQLLPASDRFQSAKLIYSFPDAVSLLGITEVCEDEFAVVVGNFSLSQAASIPGSYSVWKVDFKNHRGRKAVVSKITDIPEADFLNGMATLNVAQGTVLIGEAARGKVFILNTRTGEYEIVLSDKTMKPAPNAALVAGINGIRTTVIGKKTYLYYVNSTRRLFARVQVDTTTGKALGPYEVLDKLPKGFFADDLTIDAKDGAAYVTGNPSNNLARIPRGGESEVIVGGLNDTTIAGATADAFGVLPQDQRTLFVVTSGALAAPVNGTFTEGGKVVAIKVDRL